MERLTSVAKWAGSYSRLRSLRMLQGSQRRCLSTSGTLQYKWEPDDLKLDPDIPEYETLNIKIQGYDYPVLDSFCKYVHRMAIQLDLDCTRYSVPAMKMEINSLQFRSIIATDSCKLNYYERVVQLEDLPSIKLPILLEMIWSSAPQGVSITMKKNTIEDDENVYIPDYKKRKLEQMMVELEDRRL